MSSSRRTRAPKALRHTLSTFLALAGMAVLLSLPPEAQADDSGNQEFPRVVSVTGHGKVNAKPDLARLSFAVERRNPSMRAARDGVVRVSRDFLDLARRLGIPENKVRTSGLTIQPEYRWPDGGPRAGQAELTGYFVQRQLEVELTDLDRLGELIEGAVDIGVNQVSPPQLDSAKRRELERDALAAAALDARENARRLAETLGVKLGGLRSVSAGAVAPPPVPYLRKMEMSVAAGAAGDAATYTTGEIAFESTVTAVFDLLP